MTVHLHRDPNGGINKKYQQEAQHLPAEMHSLNLKIQYCDHITNKEKQQSSGTCKLHIISPKKTPNWLATCSESITIKSWRYQWDGSPKFIARCWQGLTLNIWRPLNITWSNTGTHQRLERLENTYCIICDLAQEVLYQGCPVLLLQTSFGLFNHFFPFRKESIVKCIVKLQFLSVFVLADCCLLSSLYVCVLKYK